MDNGKHARAENLVGEDINCKRTCSADSEVEPVTVVEPGESDGGAHVNTIHDEAEVGMDSADCVMFASEAMQERIAGIREKIEIWTAKVSTILDSGKMALTHAHDKWEEQIIQFHQHQLEAWEQEILGLHQMDVINEDIFSRLQEAKGIMDISRAQNSDC